MHCSMGVTIPLAIHSQSRVWGGMAPALSLHTSQAFYSKGSIKPESSAKPSQGTRLTRKIHFRIQTRASARGQLSGGRFNQKHRRFLQLAEETPGLRQVAAKELTAIEEESVNVASDPFEMIKNRFLTFKENHFSKKPDLFANLAASQSPKFMVIACGDSRVCPSNILGFQPGEAFVIRNVANLVPPWKESGFPATSAALEFAVLALKVEHILIIGHSRCGGIKALMSMSDDETTSSEFIGNWISIAKPARIRTKSLTADQPFDQQCSHCEKESVNQSISNLLTFPWLKELVAQEKLFLHGGYYNFVDGSFEKWTLGYKEGKFEKIDDAITNRALWC